MRLGIFSEAGAMASTTYSKAKGRAWEAALCEYLERNGFPYAERRRLNGIQDRGDIAGFPGLVIEAKHEKSYKLPEWVREAERERDNDKAEMGVVWARQNGHPDPGEGFVIMSGAQFLAMLKGWYSAI